MCIVEVELDISGMGHNEMSGGPGCKKKFKVPDDLDLIVAAGSAANNDGLAANA